MHSCAGWAAGEAEALRGEEAEEEERATWARRPGLERRQTRRRGGGRRSAAGPAAVLEEGGGGLLGGGEVEAGLGGFDGGGDGGGGGAVGDEGETGLEGGGEGEGFAAELGAVDGEEGALGGGDHAALGGDDEGVVIPDAGLGDAGAAEDGEIGVDLAEGLFAEGADEHAETAVDAAAGDDGLEGTEIGVEGGDGKGVGDDLETLGYEKTGDGVNAGAAIEDDGHAGLDEVGDAAGDGVFLDGLAFIAGDEVVFAGAFVGFEQGGAAVVAAEESADLQGIEGASDGGEGGLAARGEGVQIGVFVFADIAFDEVEALLGGHGGGGLAAGVKGVARFFVAGRGGGRKVRGMKQRPIVGLLVRWLVLALGVTLATKIVPGIKCDDGMTLFIVVVLLSFFNAVVRPILVLFTLPFIVLTMGVGLVVINALLFLLVGRLVDGFLVDGFWSALWGALIVGITNLVMASLMKRPPPPGGSNGGGGGVAGGGRIPQTRGGGRDGGGDVIDV